MAANAPGEKRYVLCNADEGEPGTFKDRVLLTECADQLLEGMAIAGYAVGSDTGIIYLRGEYRYLLPYLQSVIEGRRRQGFLGRDILGRKGSFDVRVHWAPGPTSAVRRRPDQLLRGASGDRITARRSRRRKDP
jgi:[NiFe] hydrogenase diaphorase moiety large subunit